MQRPLRWAWAPRLAVIVLLFIGTTCAANAQTDDLGACGGWPLALWRTRSFKPAARARHFALH
jgi:hypothetical protein